MQTFLPCPSFSQSLSCLDQSRLGKQRVEAKQILDMLRGKPTKSGKPYPLAMRHHPAVLMWQGFIPALKAYYNLCLQIWVGRGHVNNMKREPIKLRSVVFPPWLFNPHFCSSHRSMLLEKDPVHYGQFGWDEEPGQGYFWPVRFKEKRIT